jgi:uncharacterized membrane protein YgaE (UPF0421/DUF939 family)
MLKLNTFREQKSQNQQKIYQNFDQLLVLIPTELPTPNFICNHKQMKGKKEQPKLPETTNLFKHNDFVKVKSGFYQ